MIANRIGVDGKVFDTTFISNRSAKLTEDISREMGLTIASEVPRRSIESVDVLYNKEIPVNTAEFEQLARYFIAEMERKLRKVKRPSKGLVWYIIMWIITLASGWLGMHFAHKSQDKKKEATYWYQQYEKLSRPE